MKRALIIEKLPCHQELIPTWVWILEENGFEVDVLARAPSHRDIKKIMSNSMERTFRVVNNATPSEYDIVINNSLYPRGSRIQSNGHTGLSLTFSVLHSLPAETSLTSFPAVCKHSAHKTIALGPHIHQELESAGISSILLRPIFFGPIPTSNRKQPRTFLIQGVLEKFRRNYNILPKLVNSHASRNPPFKITLIGDSENDDLLKSLRELVSEPSHREIIQCRRNLSYDIFLQGIRASAWLMPLVDNEFSHTYFTKKITSSVMLAIGNETPMILHSDLARIYSLVHNVNCLTYSDGEENIAFQNALSMDPKEYERIHANVVSLRKEWMSSNLEKMRLCLNE
jgi:hypothetical protein